MTIGPRAPPNSSRPIFDKPLEGIPRHARKAGAGFGLDPFVSAPASTEMRPCFATAAFEGRILIDYQGKSKTPFAQFAPARPFPSFTPPSGFRNWAWAAASRAMGTRYGEQLT